MYTFKRTIDGKNIAPLNEGVTQVAPLPDFTAESKFVIINLPNNATRSVALPDNISGFEIETDLSDLRISPDDAMIFIAADAVIPSAKTTNVVASDFTHGVIAPTERRAFNLGSVTTLYLRSTTGGEVKIYVF
tara:strand:- start:409 stop:807 length:399 start_codon:yes stop_codon:yes gene_type:complete